MMTKIMILMAVFFTHLSLALTVEDPRGKVQIDMPKNWTYEQNLLGLPHVFLSEAAPKTSVSVTLTGQAGAKLNPADLKKNQGEYQTGRKTWASERGAKILRFLPYENIKLHNRQGHWLGVVYEMDGKSYEEDSLYLECPTGLVHLKILGIDQSSSLKEGQKLMKSVNCL